MATIHESDAIEGLVVVDLLVHGDERGTFTETYRSEWFPGRPEMVQSSLARRRAGAVVGLHFHRRQADYWQVVGGTARVVLHDLRRGSLTEGATLHLDVTAVGDLADPTRPATGIYIPPGVAHGIAATTDLTLTYLVDRYHDPDDELGVAWDDPEIGADWGVADPVLSARDRGNPSRSAIPDAVRPVAGAA